ncbi:Protein of unknown function [Paenibacillus sp. UNC496MF]|uniref:DUF2971 domain-containing protein n=1 Tax=Paenibacillus sp. UNC496MF TaxID=1502753 RepID=UPI0008E50EF9|nr:DUF2971 domain-containing protein [Paenibacillus sp. UNC496MF]SFJ54474.1 Protein of unknown function [Paenibacillus sp. UNC496MF]
MQNYYIENIIAGIEKELTDYFAKNQGQLPEHVYHYTSMHGLIGIIESKLMWATNYNYLNDSSEFKYGIQIFKDTVTEIISETQNPLVINLLETSREHFGSRYEMYITCFCEESNLLSQWRGYANNGGGFSLGIHTAMFRHWSAFSVYGPESDISKRETQKVFENIIFRKVIYNEAEQKKLIRETVGKIIPKIDHHISRYSGDELEEVKRLFLGLINKVVTELIISFKHPTFSEEKEWRSVYIDKDPYRTFDENVKQPNLKFRVGNNKIIPYVALPLYAKVGVNQGNLPIENITCGPTLQSDLTRKSIGMLLAINKFRIDEIRFSGIPFAT